ncbi:MAG: hypothetical protein LBP52_00805 [Burkholderiaceae bacterium]|jgi:hypothetical protein|nr:hypothetical protein [Burkholderiaceae bacterium]
MNTTTVPFAVAAYFVLYFCYCLWARIEDDWRKRRFVLAAVRGFALDLALAVPAMISWWGEPPISPRPLWWLLYIVGCASVATASVRGLRMHFPDTSLGKAENIGLAIAGFVLVVLATGPAIFWGGMWLVRNPH